MIPHHFLRDNVQKETSPFENVASEDTITDILSLPLKRESLNYLCKGAAPGTTFRFVIFFYLANGRNGQITSSGWPFVSAVLGQMAHLSDSIRPKGFMSSVLLWLVIIVAVVGVGVTVVVVVESWAKEFHQDRASSVKVPVANFTLQSSVQLLRENTDSVHSNKRIRPTAPSVPLKLIG
ncbi:hypothetical protein Tco_0531628 [Tanacetum coccineum]